MGFRPALLLTAVAAVISCPTLMRAQGLPLPPILSGYHGAAPYKTAAGGIVDPTLNNYIHAKPFVSSRGTWYNIVQWAARTYNCANYPKSVACMACAQNMPPFTYSSHVVPIGAPAIAASDLGRPVVFRDPPTICQARCSPPVLPGMCLKVYMPQSYKPCSNRAQNPYCAGSGSHPYIKYLKASWAWSAKIKYDHAYHMYYYTGIIIEWFDRAQSLPYEITMPTQNVDTTTFGDWPIKYHGVPCPVGSHKMMFQFLDFSKPVPLANGICNNQLNTPCGGTGLAFGGKTLGFLKFMITQQRVPISAVSMTINGKWQSLVRSGDGFWQPTQYDSNNPQDPNMPVDIEVYCTNGVKPLYASNVVPAKMLCSYQNPHCIGFPSSIQC